VDVACRLMILEYNC